MVHEFGDMLIVSSNPESGSEDLVLMEAGRVITEPYY